MYSSSAYDYPVTALAWSLDGELFAVGSHNTLRLCDRSGVSKLSHNTLRLYDKSGVSKVSQNTLRLGDKSVVNKAL